MKYIFIEIISGVFLFLTIGILLCNVMDTYATTIGSFPMILFICLAFPTITLFAYDILILSENIVLLNRNTEIIKNDIILTTEDRQVKYIIYISLFFLHTSYLVTLFYLLIQLNNILFFLIQYILFNISVILLCERIDRNIKLRRLLRNNETKNKHHQPAP